MDSFLKKSQILFKQKKYLEVIKVWNETFENNFDNENISNNSILKEFKLFCQRFQIIKYYNTEKLKI